MVKNLPANAGDMSFDTWVRKIQVINTTSSMLFLLAETFLCNLIYLFSFGCAELSSMCTVFSGSEWGLLSSCGACTSHCGDVTCCRVWVLEQGSRCFVACGIFDAPGIQPVSPALAGGFFTTEPPGKPYSWKHDILDMWKPTVNVIWKFRS